MGGTVSWAGMDCPVPVGPSTVKLGVHMVSILPAMFAKADMALVAVDQDGEQTVCVNTHLQKEDLAATGGCSGTDDFTTAPVCYGKTVLGEEVVVKIESYGAGAGQLSLTGSGGADISCESAFEKDDSNSMIVDNCDVSAYATVKGMQYCSDSDELKATFNPLGVPVPISEKFPRIDCPSAMLV